MSRERRIKDATEPFEFILHACHTRRGKPRNPELCALALGALDTGKVKDVRFLENVILLLFYGMDHWTRYKASPRARLIRAAVDDLLAIIPPEGYRVILLPPTGVRRLEHQRSPEFRAKQKASYEKRKGQIKRAYRRSDTLTLSEQRSMKGYGA